MSWQFSGCRHHPIQQTIGETLGELVGVFVQCGRCRETEIRRGAVTSNPVFPTRLDEINSHAYRLIKELGVEAAGSFIWYQL